MFKKLNYLLSMLDIGSKVLFIYFAVNEEWVEKRFQFAHTFMFNIGIDLFSV